MKRCLFYIAIYQVGGSWCLELVTTWGIFQLVPILHCHLLCWWQLVLGGCHLWAHSNWCLFYIVIYCVGGNWCLEAATFEYIPTGAYSTGWWQVVLGGCYLWAYSTQLVPRLTSTWLVAIGA